MLLLANVQTYWLNVTNVGLGVAVLLLLALLVRAVVEDLRSR